MNKFSDRLCEALTELLLGALLFAAGFGIVKLFGSEVNILDWDPESIVLVGLVGTTILAYAVSAIVKLIMRVRKAKGSEPPKT